MKQKLDKTSKFMTLYGETYLLPYLYRYPNKESFMADAQLMFANCEYYNEDDSEVIGNCTIISIYYYVFLL